MAEEVTVHESQHAAAEAEREAVGDATAAVANVRAELRRLRSGIERIEAELAEIERRESRPHPARRRPDRYYELLLAIYERGPHGVSTDELGALGRAQGYDRRGLGGYFAGAQAPLCLLGDRVQLTAQGAQLVHEHLVRATA